MAANYAGPTGFIMTLQGEPHLPSDTIYNARIRQNSFADWGWSEGNVEMHHCGGESTTSDECLIETAVTSARDQDLMLISRTKEQRGRLHIYLLRSKMV